MSPRPVAPVRAVLLATATALILSGCNPRIVDPQPDNPIDREFARAEQAYQARDYQTAIDVTSRLLVTDSLSRWGRWSTLLLRANSRAAAEDQAGALRDLDKALPLAEGSDVGLTQYNRFFRLRALQRDDEARAALIVVAGFPEHLHDLQLRSIRDVIKPLQQQARHAELLEVLEALHRGGYRGQRDDRPSDLVPMLLVRELAHAGRIEEARATYRDLRGFDALIELHGSKLHAPLLADPAFAREFAVERLPGIELAQAVADHAREPRKVWTATALVAALRLNGRYDESIETAREALSALRRFERDPDDELWLVDELSRSLKVAGRHAEVDALLEPLLAADPKGPTSVVNQQINYGLLLMWRDEHARAAPAARRAWDGASVYGRRYIQQVEVCGLVRTGRRAEAEPILAEILRDPSDNESAAIGAGLCAGETAAVERIVLRRLQDESTRFAQLRAFDGCRPNPHESTLARETRVALADMRKVPAIAAAIESFATPFDEKIGCDDD